MANEKYWSYQAAHTPAFAEIPQGAFSGTESQWHSLSPGMRREIVRSFERRSAK